jgi:uncharacterized Zn-binding protein involved in type VI secretion
VGAPAVTKNHRVVGICTKHLMPSASGTQPAGPRPFSAPISKGTVDSVLIAGQPAAVINSSGTNDLPTHADIVDAPYPSPTMQVGTVKSGSATVLIKGQQAATITSSATCCKGDQAKLVPGIPTVLIG